MIHHVLLTNKKGNVLLSKYTEYVGAEAQKAWEQEVFLACRPQLGAAIETSEQVAMSGDRIIVFAFTGNLFVFVSGSGEDDELELLEVVRSLLTMLRSLCKKAVTEANVVAQYPAICMMVHDMVGQGFVDVTEKDRIKTFIRLKQGGSYT